MLILSINVPISNFRIQILHKLRTGSAPHINVPDPMPVLPYLDLFSLVSLAPEKLEGAQMSIHDEAKVSQLLDGHWSVVPSLVAPSSPTTAIIHDATVLPRSFYGSSGVHVLSAKDTLSPHYWRLPAGITPILAYLLHRVAHPNPFSKSEEVRLAIRLRALLMLRYTESKGPSGGLGYGSGNLGSPVDGGGNFRSNSKRGRKRKDPATRSTVNLSRFPVPHFHQMQSIRVTPIFLGGNSKRGRKWKDPGTYSTVNLSRFSYPRMQSIRVTPIIQMMRRLQHTLMRFV
jgi:hypothetical protein